MTQLFQQTSMAFPATTINSGSIAAPSASSITFSLDRTGLPTGRTSPPDNKLCDLVGWYSTDGGSTWSTPAGHEVQGGALLDKWGNPLTTELWTFSWSGAQATHVKFQFIGVKAFTSPLVIVTAP